MFKSACLLAACLAVASTAKADPYAQSGTYNSQLYSFTAATTGDLMGYFMSKGTAVYKDEVGVLDNGVMTSGGFGLDNQTSQTDSSFDFGHVTAGDTLTFVLKNMTLGRTAYSNAAMNAAYDGAGDSVGHNHIYSTSAAGAGAMAQGTYVAFEDMTFPHSDFNYDDDAFVFTSTEATAVSAAPELSSWSLLLAGVGMVGALLRIGRRRLAAA